MTLTLTPWRQRYRHRLAQQWKDLTRQTLDELSDADVVRTLSELYPNDPEGAVDDEVRSWRACE